MRLGKGSRADQRPPPPGRHGSRRRTDGRRETHYPADGSRARPHPCLGSRRQEPRNPQARPRSRRYCNSGSKALTNPLTPARRGDYKVREARILFFILTIKSNISIARKNQIFKKCST